MPPKHDPIIGLPDFKIVRAEGSKTVQFTVQYVGQNRCPHCGAADLRIKDTFTRKIKHHSLGLCLSELFVRTHKFYCRRCDKYFSQRLPGILPRKRATEIFREEVAMKHHHGHSQKDLAQFLAIGQATVERWYKDFVHLWSQQRTNAFCPKVMGIDEHFFTKKQGYATTFANLAKGKVFDVQLGRTEASLKAYLLRLPGRSNVRVVVMDLSESYRSLVKKYFGQALIVADRFHVVRLINHHFLKTWSDLDPVGRKNRGLLSLMRRHPENLRPDQQLRLREYLQTIPALEHIYDFKQRLMALMKLKALSKDQCRRKIPEYLQMIADLQNCGFSHLETLGRTLSDWAEEIARMWRFTKTNSITEGLHTKMEMISRRAFGFRNFENYRLRVRAHCG